MNHKNTASAQINPDDRVRVIRPRVLDLVGVRSGFSLRHGGVSRPPFRSLNTGLSTGDDAEAVHENRRRLFAACGVDIDRAAIAGQVHADRVKLIQGPGLYRGFDALVTRSPQIVLCITSADCAVILLADPVARIVAACHSGWRGTAAGIVVRTVEAMEAAGAVGDRLRAYIGPSICVEHFEVGSEVATEFSSEYVVERSDWPKPHVDLKSAIAGQLKGAGLRQESIEISPHCTFSETHDFFSYRAENGATGRMMGFISLL